VVSHSSKTRSKTVENVAVVKHRVGSSGLWRCVDLNVRPELRHRYWPHDIGRTREDNIKMYVTTMLWTGLKLRKRRALANIPINLPSSIEVGEFLYYPGEYSFW
jgi:hypothetical protein